MAIDYTRTFDTRIVVKRVDPSDLYAEHDEPGRVLSGTINFAYYTDTRVTGELNLLLADDEDPRELLRGLLRVYANLTQDEQTETLMLGTFFVGWSSVRHEYGSRIVDLQLVSTLASLTDPQHYCNNWTGAGEDVGDKLEEYVAEYWPHFEFDMPATSCPSLVQTCAAGDPALTRVQTLVETVNGQLNVTPRGVIVVRPYTAPVNRTPGYTFDETNAVYKAGAEEGSSAKDIPNRVVCTCLNKAGTLYLYSYRDLDTGSVWSKAARGRIITAYYSVEMDADDSDATRRSKLEAAALSHFNALVTVTETVTISHKYNGLRQGDVVVLRYADSDRGVELSGTYLVQETTIDLAPGLIAETILRKVSDYTDGTTTTG